ncbi:MAG: YqeG family HAD IIIA-type phosphatase [Clostridia bacterium]|nr:YqeG family HAD IIIA-type phosphatase [Clostridia bacterium]
MLEKLYPDLYLDKVQDIDLDFLRKHNIKGLILDIDNTLVPHGLEADDNAVAWMERVQAEGFKVCIVSNASKKRVIKFNERLRVAAIHRASKPGTRAFLKALEIMGLMPGEAAVVGDQIFTDIYGGNRLNLLTILVKPIDKKEFFIVRLKRIFEKGILSKYHMESGEKREKRLFKKREILRKNNEGWGQYGN